MAVQCGVRDAPFPSAPHSVHSEICRHAAECMRVAGPFNLTQLNC